MDDLLWLLLGLAGGLAFHYFRTRRGPGTPESPSPRLYQLAAELQPFYTQLSHPRELLGSSVFQEGCDILADPEYTTQDLIVYASGGNQVIASMALETLRRRTDIDAETVDRVLGILDELSNWARFFALGAIDAHSRQPLRPVVPHVLRVLDESWSTRRAREILLDFLHSRKEVGEDLHFWSLASVEDGDMRFALSLLEAADSGLGTTLAQEFRSWAGESSGSTLDLSHLASFGQILSPESCQDLVPSPTLTASVAAAERVLAAEAPRSVLLVGESGVGKTSAIRVLVARLLEQGWTVFRASGPEVLAGQTYIGQLEERIQRFLETVRGHPKFLWVVPAFHELAQLGRHRQSEVSILDLILPAIENDTLRLVGEIQPQAYERVVQMRPRIGHVFENLRIPPLAPEPTCEVVRLWVERMTKPGTLPLIDDSLLQETFQLARQYLGERANPGAMLDLLRLALKNRGAELAWEPLKLDDILFTLARLTGLPRAVLDDRQPLDLDRVRDFLQGRVLGQVEAVSCLVERIAMIKAGLTDPTRPQGVFLFTGPTGTGKTELAKTLAEFLFGSAERMVRLDMSEFQTWESFTRILGDADPQSNQVSLVHEIRRQPFSVILLDEFEKAHPRIWDVFLQVFDDGRLTDGRGNVADCRHTIIILTANVGSDSAGGASIGFRRESASRSDDDTGLENSLTEMFRRELLNRIDRIVTFEPLPRSVMRDVLRKELELALERRGLRRRQWAVEWDESALEFLLERGFSVRYGARPLKRAVERYLLSPLATTIVTHAFPEGDQFLFVRAGEDGIEVEFVDPDAPELETVRQGEEVGAEPGDLQVESLALDARGDATEVAVLEAVRARLVETVQSDSWRASKSKALEQMSTAAFWSSEERFEVLGGLEYRDRIEAGLETAGSLLRRLVGSQPGARQRYPQYLVRRLAEQLFLVGSAIDGLLAGEAQDAYLLVSGTRDSLADAAETDRFAVRIAGMYRCWAQHRRMALEVLEERNAATSEPYRFVAAVSGYAAYRLLRTEEGFHVLESPPPHPRRSRVRVVVAPQDDAPAPRKHARKRARALGVLEEALRGRAEIVRRYREEPSPLVRDSVRGWRTGRLAQVLDGNFDLFG